MIQTDIGFSDDASRTRQTPPQYHAREERLGVLTAHHPRYSAQTSELKHIVTIARLAGANTWRSRLLFLPFVRCNSAR